MKRTLIVTLSALLLFILTACGGGAEPKTREDIADEGYEAVLAVYNSELDASLHGDFDKTRVTCFNHSTYLGREITVEISEGISVTYGADFADEAMATYYYLFEDVRLVDYEEAEDLFMIYEYKPATGEVKSCNTPDSDSPYGYTCDVEEFHRVRELDNVFLITDSLFKGYELNPNDDGNGISYSYLSSSDSYGIYKADTSLVASDLTVPTTYRGKPVTEIYSGAFSDCGGLTGRLTVGDGILSVGDYAFARCGFDEIVIGDTVREIGCGAFSTCDSVESITVGKGLASIGAELHFPRLREIVYNTSSSLSVKPDAVYQSNNLFVFEAGDTCNLSIRIGADVTEIPSSFIFCRSANVSIESLTFEEGDGSGGMRLSIGETAFYGNGALTLKELMLPEGREVEIGAAAFFQCTGLERLSLGSTVSIGGSAFALDGCSLEELVIPDSTVEIGDGAFYGLSSVKSLTVGSGVRHIYDMAFAGLTSLTEINWYPIEITTLGNSVFRECGSQGDGTTVTVHTTVKRIPDSLFQTSNTNVTTVIFDSPEHSSLEYIGFCAFNPCRATVIGLPVCEMGWNAFSSTVTVYCYGEHAEFDFGGANPYPSGRCIFYSEAEAAGCWHYADDERTPLVWGE